MLFVADYFTGPIRRMCGLVGSWSHGVYDAHWNGLYFKWYFSYFVLNWKKLKLNLGYDDGNLLSQGQCYPLCLHFRCRLMLNRRMSYLI